MNSFHALLARQDGDQIVTAFETLEPADLPPGDVTIRVAYSGVNFKDALAVTPKGGVVREYPIVPGIDMAGEVIESQSQEFAPGDQVLAHGYDIRTGRHGGYAEIARVPAAQVVRLGALSAQDAMAIGTAGLTAAMSVQALIARGITPGDGPILVTGATGGVGSVAIDLLAATGYTVVASTGKPDATDHLKQLGACEVIGRLPEDPDAKPRPLGRTKWAAAVDCVGGAEHHRDAVHPARCRPSRYRLGTATHRTAPGAVAPTWRRAAATSPRGGFPHRRRQGRGVGDR